LNRVGFLAGLRRRWWVVASSVLVGVVAAGVIDARAPQKRAGDDATYRATAVLLAQGTTADDAILNLDALSTLATVGEVPERAAAALKYPGSPLLLADEIDVATADPKEGGDTGVLTITATAPSAKSAEDIANTFAAGLVTFVQGQLAQAGQGELQRMEAQIERLRVEVTALEALMPKAPGVLPSPALAQQQQAKLAEYGQLIGTYEELKSAPAGALKVLQAARANKTPPAGGIKVPTTTKGRVALGGLLGLLCGLGMVFVLERFDTRMRTKEEAEEAFGAPVLGEIPRMSRAKRRRIAAAVDPVSQNAEAFRMLATQMNGLVALKAANEAVVKPGEGSFLRMASRSRSATIGGDRSLPAPSPAEGQAGRLILVTSSAPSEGKTTLAANLAVTLAERGQTVLVLSCDLRRPRVHELLGTGNHLPGIIDILRSPKGQGPTLAEVTLRTPFKGVSFVPAGISSKGVAELFGTVRMRELLNEARAAADVVVIDSAPLLVASDSTLLLSDVDEVLVVARSGRTTAKVAARTAELLKRLDAPITGVAFNSSGQVLGYYHRYRGYYGESEGQRPTDGEGLAGGTAGAGPSGASREGVA
jgi:capsular exopolysaccharide synthesis family protein